MRYIGNKMKIAEKIMEIISPSAEDVIFDAFSGVGGMTNKFSIKNKTITNDYMYYAHCISHALNCHLDIDRIEKLIQELFNKNDVIGFVTENYSMYNDNKRMYFSIQNAIKIDTIRSGIESFKQQNIISSDEEKFLIALLLEAVSKVANIAGVYGSYLKKWDKRALKDLEYVIPSKYRHKRIAGGENYNMEIEELVSAIKCDIIYIDPPYTKNQYASQYHLLETIAKYDNPCIKGKTGTRESKVMSNYSKEKMAIESMIILLIKSNAKKAFISYNNNGLINTETFETYLKLLDKKFKKHEFSYDNYKNSKTISRDNKEIVYELSLAEIFVKSPLNYSGGKFNIVKFLNENMKCEPGDTFIDVFGGGLNVGININVKKVIYNDINTHVYEILKRLKKGDFNEIHTKLVNIIHEFQPTTKNGFLELRKYYNENFKKLGDRELYLYVLVIHSFNQQFRFNSRGEFNNTFHGKVGYNNIIRARLHIFIIKLKSVDVEFYNLPYLKFLKDVEIGKMEYIYMDPPYLITTASYNDGKRLYGNWCVADEIELYKQINMLREKSVRVSLSNVVMHQGEENTILKKFIESVDKIEEYSISDKTRKEMFWNI